MFHFNFLVFGMEVYRGPKSSSIFLGFVGDGMVKLFFYHLSLLREVALRMFATLMEFWSYVCDFPGYKLQHFVEQYDGYGEFHNSHPFVYA